VKLVPTRHQLMVTVPLPDVRPNQPITRIINLLYVDTSKDGCKRLIADYRQAIGQDPNKMIVTFYDGARSDAAHALQSRAMSSFTTAMRRQASRTRP
jgi:branched-chain amino acid transport system substrate-binding protein